MSSSEFKPLGDLWARHYRAASKRRRARGWHRRDEAKPRHRNRAASRKVRFYVAAAVVFVAFTAIALILPR
jgi:hypothetical protein